jgi:hypothetical protein
MLRCGKRYLTSALRSAGYLINLQQRRIKGMLGDFRGLEVTSSM